MIDKQFDELKHTGNLPSPSAVGLKVLCLLEQEDWSIAELANTIQIDPALTGRIIKLANSANSGSNQSISSVREASVRLGLRTVSNLALGFTLISGNRSGACKGFDYDGYWADSLARAVAAQRLADALGCVDPAEAFTCALLSRVGELALASVHPNAYSEILLSNSEGDAERLLELEDEQFGINHREVAVAMMGDWGLPDSFGHAAYLFRRPDEQIDTDDEGVQTMIWVLRSAVILARLFRCLESCPTDWQELQKIERRLDCTPEQFNSLFDSAAKEWSEWGRSLSVPTGNVPSFDSLQRQVELQAGRSALDLDDTEHDVPAGDGLRILAVDDDPMSLRILQQLLSKAGHTVITADNGREALAVALKENPQLVISDWMMPEMDGLELCRALRRFRAGRNIYFLLLTGRGEEDRVVEAFDTGIDDYVEKPFKSKILLSRVNAGQRVVRLQDQVEEDKRIHRESVAKLAVMTRKLRALAQTDVLTGIPNRRYAMHCLNKEWGAGSNRKLCVIMADIDYFKRINDTHGHDVGDVVLKETARILSRSIRGTDVCARIGGEEFLVICTGSEFEGALQCAERVRRAVEEHVVESDTFRGGVTLSMGVAERTEHTANIDALLKLADDAVYRAKNSGRNQVCRGEADHRRSA